MDSFPKIIHQIYGFWDNNIPSHIARRIRSWKRLHPQYKYMLWSKKNSREFIKTNYNWFLSLYDNYVYPVQKADALRYFLLYHYGGIYCDIDLEPVKSLEPLLEKYKDKQALVYKSANCDMLTNDFMVSKPKNVFWKRVWNELIKNYNYSSFSKHLEIMYTTGPLMFDNVYENFSHKDRYVYVVNSKYINTCDVTQPKPCTNKDGYLKRHEGNSWHGMDSTLYNFVYSNYPILIIFAILLFIIFQIV